MASARPTSTSKAAVTSDASNSGFRLGGDHLSDQSDSDQSAHSERSLSPSKTSAKVSRSKKRRELRQGRRQVGALTDELGTLLGAAFQAPDGDHEKTDVASGDGEPAIADQVMEIEITPAEKTLSKRTRQNIAKMEKRRMARERHQQSKLRQQNAAAEQKHLPLNEQQRRQKETKKNATQSRRQRKEKQRAREVAGQGDAMDIG